MPPPPEGTSATAPPNAISTKEVKDFAIKRLLDNIQRDIAAARNKCDRVRQHINKTEWHMAGIQSDIKTTQDKYDTLRNLFEFESDTADTHNACPNAKAPDCTSQKGWFYGIAHEKDYAELSPGSELQSILNPVVALEPLNAPGPSAGGQPKKYGPPGKHPLCIDEYHQAACPRKEARGIVTPQPVILEPTCLAPNSPMEHVPRSAAITGQNGYTKPAPRTEPLSKTSQPIYTASANNTKAQGVQRRVDGTVVENQNNHVPQTVRPHKSNSPLLLLQDCLLSSPFRSPTYEDLTKLGHNIASNEAETIKHNDQYRRIAELKAKHEGLYYRIPLLELALPCGAGKETKEVQEARLILKHYHALMTLIRESGPDTPLADIKVMEDSMTMVLKSMASVPTTPSFPPTVQAADAASPMADSFRPFNRSERQDLPSIESLENKFVDLREIGSKRVAKTLTTNASSHECPYAQLPILGFEDSTRGRGQRIVGSTARAFEELSPEERATGISRAMGSVGEPASMHIMLNLGGHDPIPFE
jgi:hypothetical protein